MNALTSFENQRTHQEHEDSLLLKRMALQVGGLSLIWA